MKTPAVLMLAVLVSVSGCSTVKSVGNAVWPFGGKNKSEERVAASTSEQSTAESAPVARPAPPSRQPTPPSAAAASNTPASSSATAPYSGPPQRNTGGTEAPTPRGYTQADYLAVMTPGEVAVLQERARSSGKTSYELTDFLTEKEKISLQERAALRRSSAAR
jgi:hypothetical protein